MHGGFKQAREDLWDDRGGRPIETAYGSVSTPSSAVGSSWPWGHPGTLPVKQHAVQPSTYELPEHVERKFQELVSQLTGRLTVTLDGLRQDEGSVLVFIGHTDDEDVLVAVDHGPAELLLDSIATLSGDTVVEVEAWQVISRVAR